MARPDPFKVWTNSFPFSPLNRIFERPLKQAAGTGIGILLTVALFSLLTYFYTIPGLYAATFVTIAAASFFMAKLESVRPLNAIVWNLALTALAAASTFLLMRIL